MENSQFIQRLKQYKEAIKPRQQIRLKLQKITNGLGLSQLNRMDRRVVRNFRVNQVHKIEPQIAEFAERHRRIREGRRVLTQSMEVVRSKNKVNETKIQNSRLRERLKLHSILEQISNTTEARTQRIVNNANCSNLLTFR